MFNRIIYLVLSATMLSASPMPKNSVARMNTTTKYPQKVSKVIDNRGSDAIVMTKEFLIRFGFAVYYYA